MDGLRFLAGQFSHLSIRVDHAQGVVAASKGTVPVAAVTDPDGHGLGVYTLDVRLDRLDAGRPFRVRNGVPRLLSLDFNLDASNSVDLANPAAPKVTVAPFIVADVDVGI